MNNNPLSPGTGAFDQSGVPELQVRQGGSLNTSPPRRRGNVAQPPALVTSLSGLQFQSLNVPASSGGYLTTPTTMNSPFFSSGPLSGMTSPLSARPTPYNTAYNPQEWGPIAPGSSPVGIGVITPGNNATHRPLVNRADAASPPPPYSPPRSQNPASSNSPQLRMSSPNTSGLSPPMVHPRDLSPIGRARPPPPPPPPPPPLAPVNQYSTPRPRPASMISSSGLDAQNQQPVFMSPTQSSGAPHSSMRTDNSPLNTFAGSSSRHGMQSTVVSPGRVSPEAYHDLQDLRSIPPAARRAASTGDINPSTRTTFSPDGSITSGGWEPGMPLPPPPPGPPPRASPRARQSSLEPLPSTSGVGRNRPQPPSTGTALGSVPPTPAVLISDIIGRLRANRAHFSSAYPAGFQQTRQSQGIKRASH
ncbi:predicted protein [Uncinocarpus reesii 1704]|uniref:Uncharacterized protein n=1 Tax=Uncinocarpus reesii (strain UAMH 1704) TaxID=336963 RepID=C4JS42_UNCRE|nr:uncharacterized protein UREG_05281 [Uncinocarpus reesii 1704]EEP80439.1 predicted protein [Uncinocarpus reesii 1704]